MEFDFNINNLFGSEITVLDKNLTPFRTSPGNFRDFKKQICTVVDKMGMASAKAQGLDGPVTSTSRMISSNHKLYIMIDANANGGNGAVVGLLKVGVKKLFVFDAEGAQHETSPCCALDFYVHESRQRTGCGRRIFDFMLQNEGVKPPEMAIDQPSHKFLAFLAKHYGLRSTIPQRYKFVIFDGFFKTSPQRRKRPLDGAKPPSHPYCRQETRQRDMYERNFTRTSSLPSGHSSPHIYSESPHPHLSRQGAYTSMDQPCPDDPAESRRASSAGEGPRASICRLLCWTEPPSPEKQPDKADELTENVSSKLRIRSAECRRPEEDNQMIDPLRQQNRPSSGHKTHHLPPIDKQVMSSRNISPPGSQMNSPRHQPPHINRGSPPSIRRDGPSADYISLHQGGKPPSHIHQYPPSHPGRGFPDSQPYHGVGAPRNLPPSSMVTADSSTPNPFAPRNYKPREDRSAWNVFGVPHSRPTPDACCNPENQNRANYLSKYRFYKQW